MSEVINSNNYYLVAKGGLNGKADTWIKIDGSIKITSENGMPLHIEANNDLIFEGFGDMVNLTKDPFKYIDNIQPTPTIIKEDNIINDIDFNQYIKIPIYVNEYQDYYFNIYKSFIKNKPIGQPEVRLEFPSNSISYHDAAKEGIRMYSTVSVYQIINNQEILILQSKDRIGAIEGEKPDGNNHGCYFLLPIGYFKVVISNDGNTGGNVNWIKSECFRQDSLSASAYYEFGNPEYITPGQSSTFYFNTFGVNDKPSGLIKINNVSRK